MEEFKKQPELSAFIQQIADKQGLEQYSITDVQTNAKGEGFLGKIWMITLRDEVTEKPFNFILKSAFSDDRIRNAVPIRMSYENEVYFYSEILSAYKNLSPSFVFAPACFGVSLTDTAEMLALENLKSAGFEIFNKYSVLDHDHVKLIFDTYGKFHACSFALQQNHPEKFKEISGKTHNVFDGLSEAGMHKVFTKGINAIKKFLVPGTDDTIIDSLKKYEGTSLIKVFNESNSKSKFITIVHGDCWSNNMMFKYQETDSTRKPIEMRLLDFQLITFGSLACDLSYFLYSGGSKEVFDRLEEYLQSYYQQFTSFLRQLGGHPEKAFSFEDLKEEWRMFAKFGFIMSLGTWQLKFTASEKIQDLTDMSDDPSEYENESGRFDEELYFNRLKEIMDNMLKLNAL